LFLIFLREKIVTEDSKIELFITIENTLGIHARPASMFVQLASQFDSEVIVRNGNDEVDGKSLMGLLMLAAGKGAQLTLVFSGSDAEDARDAFHDLIVVRKFDEN
jgi:phosphocarrier protein HPr